MKYKVLHVVRDAEGGIAAHVRTLLHGLDGNRYRQMVVGPQDVIVRVEGSQAAALPIGDGIKLLPDLRAVVGLGRILRQEQPHLLHLHGYKAGLIGMTALGAAAGRGLRRRPRALLTAHNMPPVNRGWKGMPTRAMLAQLTHFPERVIAVSDALGKAIDALTPGRAPGRAETVYNGIDLAHFPPPESLRGRYREQVRRALGYDANTLAIGTIARLIPSKGVSLLIQAAARMVADGFQGAFLVVGDGPSRETLEAEAKAALPDGTIRFLGFRRDVPQLLSALDLFVLPSIVEGQSITAAEAMAAGLPVVAARTGGVPEVVVDGESGILVAPGSSEAIAQAALDLLTGDAGRLKRMGAAGRRRVEERFSQERMLSKTDRIYRSLLDG